jgi:acyl-coenzyme A synthetase/AMP-(fatty) acid ligase
MDYASCMDIQVYRLENNRPHDYGGPLERPFEPLEPLLDSLPLYRLIERHAEVFADKPAVVTPERVLTFGELRALALGYCSALMPHLRQGEIIRPVFCLSADSCVQVAVALACWRLGFAHAPLDPDMPAARCRDLVRAARDPVVVAEPGQAERMELAETGAAVVDASLDVRDREPRLPAFPSSATAGSIVFTSGSTGEPKGIVHSQSAIARQMAAKVRNGWSAPKRWSTF